VWKPLTYLKQNPLKKLDPSIPEGVFSFSTTRRRSPLYQDLLRDEQLLGFLLACDRDLAQNARDGGCGRCGGKLHRADYGRKPRGGPPGAEQGTATRYSFCCAVDGCRARLTPPSLRFLGRRVYFTAVMVLVQAMQHGPSPARIVELEHLVGVSARTLRRWRRLWLSTFATSRFWKATCARLSRPVAASGLPHDLLDCFSGDARSRLVSLLRFLSPITGGSAAVELAS
jgi:hypothetical protein